MIASFCILIKNYPKISIRLNVGTRPHLKVFLNGFQAFLKWHMQSLLHFSSILVFLTLSSRFSYSFFYKIYLQTTFVDDCKPFSPAWIPYTPSEAASSASMVIGSVKQQRSRVRASRHGAGSKAKWKGVHSLLTFLCQKEENEWKNRAVGKQQPDRNSVSNVDIPSKSFVLSQQQKQG